MRVLVLGTEAEAKQVFPADTHFCHKAGSGLYDAIFLGHYLQTLKRKEVEPFLREMRTKLQENGELWVSTPSLEWACYEMVKKDIPGMEAWVAIYGTDAEPNPCGFTMSMLRSAIENTGYIVRQAIQEQYTVKINDTTVGAVQNLVVGLKHDGDPAEALQ